MAGKTKDMSQIKQLLRLHQQGKKIKFIARVLGISKNTVKQYLNKEELSPQHIDSLLLLEDQELEAKFHAGNPAYKDGRFEHFKSRLEHFFDELKRDGVTKHLLWEEYLQAYPSGYSYSQFCFHLSQHIIAGKPSMVLQHKAGEKLFIDFAGKKLSYINPDTGEIIYSQVFVACFPYSDYGFAIAVPTQSVADFIYALTCCLQFFGGVPQVIVPDNFKAAIVKANPYEPELNKALEDFANHYQTIVLPARVAKPKDKALVENQVKLIYNRVYAKLRNMQFFSLAALNEAILEKVKAHNQTRMQKKPYCREERFLAEEKPLLSPLPSEPFDLKYYRQYTVAKNNHIYLAQDHHYYSVPYPFIGQKVKVVFTRSLVRVFKNTKQIALHQRNYKKGGYSTIKEHLCSQHQHYLDRSPEFYIRKAKEKSGSLYQLIQLIFEQERHPEQLYRTCDGLFSLQRKTEQGTFDKACNLAIEYQNYSYTFITNILKNKMTQFTESEGPKPLPVHKNVRGKGYYEQTSL
jgi:transposase